MVDEHVKFALNSAVDTLPHNANLALWKKRMNDACTLCGERQTLIHVLNTCAVARDNQRFNGRHHSLLREIVAIIMIYLPSNAHLTCDLGEYSFPQHIVATDLHPDIVWWDDTARSMNVVELTVPFETSFVEVAERKSVKYVNLVQQARVSGYAAKLITLEVGSRGVINMSGFVQLKEELNITKKKTIPFC